jgi:hypothetical protein
VAPLPGNHRCAGYQTSCSGRTARAATSRQAVAMTNRCVDNILAIRDRRPLGGDPLDPETLAG